MALTWGEGGEWGTWPRDHIALRSQEGSHLSSNPTGQAQAAALRLGFKGIVQKSKG